MTAWIAVGVGALVLVVGGLVGTYLGRKLLAVACGLVVLVAAGSQINRYFFNAVYWLGELIGIPEVLSQVGFQLMRFWS